MVVVVVVGVAVVLVLVLLVQVPVQLCRCRCTRIAPPVSHQVTGRKKPTPATKIMSRVLRCVKFRTDLYCPKKSFACRRGPTE